VRGVLLLSALISLTAIPLSLVITTLVFRLVGFLTGTELSINIMKVMADNRLDAIARHLVGEFQRPEHVVGIGQRQRRLAVGLCQFAELGDLDRALQQRIRRMNVEMNESGTGHGRLTGSCIMVGSDHRPRMRTDSPPQW
jgi:hypothetical protein